LTAASGKKKHHHLPAYENCKNQAFPEADQTKPGPALQQVKKQGCCRIRTSVLLNTLTHQQPPDQQLQSRSSRACIQRQRFLLSGKQFISFGKGHRDSTKGFLVLQCHYFILTIESSPGAECFSLKFSSAKGPLYMLATPVPSPCTRAVPGQPQHFFCSHCYRTIPFKN